MRYLVWGLMFLVACVSPVIQEIRPPEIASQLAAVVRVDIPTVRDESGNVLSIGMDGTAIAYKATRTVDNKYDVYFLTAAHVARPAQTVQSYIHILVGPNGVPGEAPVKTYPISLQSIKINPDLDVAVFEAVLDSPIPLVNLGKTPKAAQEVYTLSIPMGITILTTAGYTAGYSNGVWVYAANVFLGSSGGGVFDKATGSLIGIISKMYVQQEGFNPIYVEFMGQFTAYVDFSQWMAKEKLL